MDAEPTPRDLHTTRRPDDGLGSLFSARRWRELGRLLELTPRQLEVARLLCADCSHKEIARRLGLANDTVGTHLRGLYRRLNVRSRLGVVVRLVLAERALVRRASRNSAR